MFICILILLVFCMNKDRNHNFKHHATHYTEYQKRDKCSVIYLKKSEMYWPYTSNVKLLIKYRIPQIELLMFLYLVIAFDPYG